MVSFSLASLQLAVRLTLRQSELSCCLLQGSFFLKLFAAHQLFYPSRHVLARRLRVHRFFRSADQQSDLALSVAALRQLLQDVVGTPAQKLFVHLRDLTSDNNVAFRPENLHDVAQALDQPMRRFVEDLRARRFADGLQRSPPRPALRGEEAAKAKRIGWQAAGDQSRQERRSAWDRHHANVMAV